MYSIYIHFVKKKCKSYANTSRFSLIFFTNICVGGYDKEDKAARAYDLAALKYWGTTTTTNFPVQIFFFLKKDLKR